MPVVYRYVDVTETSERPAASWYRAIEYGATRQALNSSVHNRVDARASGYFCSRIKRPSAVKNEKEKENVWYA